MTKFSERLKSLRTEKGISQETLAKNINYSRIAILQWEKGIRVPDINAAIAIANFFGVTTDYLLGVTEY